MVTVSPRRLLIDANLLLLLIVGRASRGWVSTFKRTNKYTADSFDGLETLISGNAGLVSTPNLLTEVSNLLNPAKGIQREILYGMLGQVIATMHEVYVPSESVTNRDSFWLFGLTDEGIAEAAANTRSVVITDDLRLASQLAIAEIEVVNFNQFR